MDAPKYQAILAKDIPVVPLTTSEAGDAEKLTGENSIRVIAGAAENYGMKGAASVHTPVELLDIRMATQGVSFDIPVPDGHNTIVVGRAAITYAALRCRQNVFVFESEPT